MKRTNILATLLLIGGTLTANGQYATETPAAIGLKLGPQFAAGAAVNAGDVATGTKIAPGFAYSPGALFELSYGQKMAFDLGVVYDSRTINFHDQANDAIGVDFSLGYLALRPSFRFSGMLIGLGFGIPVSVSTTSLGGAATPSLTSSDLQSLFEVRWGGTVDLLSNEKGTLNFRIEGSYAFSKIRDGSSIYSSDPSQNNGPLASVEVGFSYLFDLSPRVAEPAVAVNWIDIGN